LAYRVAPINVKSDAVFGMIDTKRMYQRLVEEFEWGGIDNPDIYMDENNIRMTIKYRYAFASLARAFVEEDNSEKAVEVLDYCMDHMPHEQIPFNFSIVPIIQSYYTANAIDKAVELTRKMEELMDQDLQYFTEAIKKKPEKAEKMLQAIRDLNTLGSIAMGFGETEVAQGLQEKVEMYVPVYEQFFALR
jgi:hypothetical protein